MRPPDDPIVLAILNGVETRSTEFKESQSLDNIRWKIIKACMAMANLRDGGRLIIGMTERDGIARAAGMSVEDAQTFQQDTVLELVNRFANPPTSLTLRHVPLQDLTFVGIEIAPFDKYPVMCVRETPHNISRPADRLLPGEIYARSNERIATTRVVTPELLAEILEISAERRAAEIISLSQRIGFQMPDTVNDAFAREREDFGDLP